jgi:hypothetical protein
LVKVRLKNATYLKFQYIFDTFGLYRQNFIEFQFKNATYIKFQYIFDTVGLYRQNFIEFQFKNVIKQLLIANFAQKNAPQNYIFFNFKNSTKTNILHQITHKNILFKAQKSPNSNEKRNTELHRAKIASVQQRMRKILPSGHLSFARVRLCRKNGRMRFSFLLGFLPFFTLFLSLLFLNDGENGGG